MSQQNEKSRTPQIKGEEGMREELYKNRPINWRVNIYGYVEASIRGKTVKQHRYVMENFLGRPLTSSELVHHKDGNKKNNDISNLELTNFSEHGKHHYLLGPNRNYGKSRFKCGSKHIRAKINEEIVKSIKNDLKIGLSQASIARKFNLDFRHISKIKNGLCWKQVSW